MRAFITLLMFVALTATATEPPHIPLTNQVIGYKRKRPVFQSTQIPGEQGDALLVLLDGGRAIDRWMKNGFPPGVVCVLPAPAHLWMTVILTNGTTYSMGFSHDGGLLYLPGGLYEVSNVARTPIAEVMAELDADLRREIVSAPRPCAYRMGTVNDGGTLSGVARLFYGDAGNGDRFTRPTNQPSKTRM